MRNLLARYSFNFSPGLGFYPLEKLAEDDNNMPALLFNSLDITEPASRDVIEQ